MKWFVFALSTWALDEVVDIMFSMLYFAIQALERGCVA